MMRWDGLWRKGAGTTDDPNNGRLILRLTGFYAYRNCRHSDNWKALWRALYWTLLRRYETELCQHCGRPVRVVFHAPDDLWELATGFPRYPDGESAPGILCPPCVDELVEPKVDGYLTWTCEVTRWQHAADRAGFTLDEWVRDYLGAASDPDAGEVTGSGTPGAQQTQSDNEQAELRISEALDLGLQVWRTQPDVRDKFLTAQDDLGSLLARLTTAEQERDKAMAAIQSWRENYQANDDAKYEALDKAFRSEARVEAAVSLLAREMYAAAEPLANEYRADWDSDSLLSDEYDEYLTRARAALARPPQQRGEK